MSTETNAMQVRCSCAGFFWWRQLSSTTWWWFHCGWPSRCRTIRTFFSGWLPTTCATPSIWPMSVWWGRVCASSATGCGSTSSTRRGVTTPVVSGSNWMWPSSFRLTYHISTSESIRPHYGYPACSRPVDQLRFTHFSLTIIWLTTGTFQVYRLESLLFHSN